MHTYMIDCERRAKGYKAAHSVHIHTLIQYTHYTHTTARYEMRKHFDFIYPSYEMDVCDEDHVSYSLLLPTNFYESIIQ